MGKKFGIGLLSLFIFSATFKLFCMPATDGTQAMPTGMPTPPDAGQAAVGMPTPPDAGQAAVGMPTPPDAGQAAAGMPTPPVTTDASQAAAQPTTPTDNIKPEQLGEFEVKEDQPPLAQNQDAEIRKLVNKSNELSKQINDIATKINEIRDKAFNTFSTLNDSIDAFYQKMGSEFGKTKELLTEQK
jgi:peptidoglycan hydrolase CwlO-like protein